MSQKFYRYFLALILFALLLPTAYGQIFQRLYSYTPQGGLVVGYPPDIGGGILDVQVLEPSLSGTRNIATIGISAQSSNAAVVSLFNPDGTVIDFYEFTGTTPSNSLAGMAISQLPDGDLVACIHDPGSFSSHVIRMTTQGAVVWAREIPDFWVHDAECGNSSRLKIDADAIWMTGQSRHGTFALVCMDSRGDLVYEHEYGFDHPGPFGFFWYNESVGYELDYEPVSQHILIVGKGATWAGLDEMVLLRTDQAGNPLWARKYGNLDEDHAYGGKAVTPAADPATGHVIAFDFAKNAGLESGVGMMQIDWAGQPTWINAHYDVGEMDGENYVAHGVATDGDGYMTVGYFDLGAATQPTAYSLSVNGSGKSASSTTYQSATVYPAHDTRMMAVDYHGHTGKMILGGYYEAESNSGAWPQGTTPKSFWMVGAEPSGLSECSVFNGPDPEKLNPETLFMQVGMQSFTRLVPSSLDAVAADSKEVRQCFGPGKRDVLAEERENLGINASYLGEENKIRVRIPNLEIAGGLQLMDLQGRTLAQMEARTGDQFFSTEQLGKGVYLLRYNLPGLTRGTEKILVH